MSATQTQKNHKTKTKGEKPQNPQKGEKHKNQKHFGLCVVFCISNKACGSLTQEVVVC